MASPQSYLDNLENLRAVMSVALEHAQKNCDQLMKNGTGEQMRRAERLIGKIRTLAEQLEKEFNVLESLITKMRSSAGDRRFGSRVSEASAQRVKHARSADRTLNTQLFS
jgi:hypothetical protein